MAPIWTLRQIFHFGHFSGNSTFGRSTLFLHLPFGHPSFKHGENNCICSEIRFPCCRLFNDKIGWQIYRIKVGEMCVWEHWQFNKCYSICIIRFWAVNHDKRIGTFFSSKVYFCKCKSLHASFSILWKLVSIVVWCSGSLHRIEDWKNGIEKYSCKEDGETRETIEPMNAFFLLYLFVIRCTQCLSANFNSTPFFLVL